MASPVSLRFVLNEQDVEIASIDGPTGGLSVLDFARRHRRLTGTKEGCKEGDCGACTVLIGELVDPSETDDAIRYAPVTSCMMPVAELGGKHLVTIEGLDLGRCNTTQRRLVEHGASQCGFCTPGIAVSLVGRLMDGQAPAADADRLPDEVDRALSGHLCRCTGYRSLRAASADAFRDLADHQGVEALVAADELPGYFLDIPARLRALRDVAEPVTIDPERPWIAGGTDLYVQRGEDLPIESIHALDAWRAERPALRGITLDGDWLRIGALTRFEDLAESPLLRQRLPRIGEHLDLIASWQIRNRATVGGNLINASPIGDVTILMLALEAVARFEDVSTGEQRDVPLARLYQGYKQLDRRPSEVLVDVRVPEIRADDHVHFEKVSKRRWLDIATVNAAIRLRVEEGEVTSAAVAAGGVAPIPLRLERTSAALIGRRITLDTLRETLALADAEITPIDDVRGSAAYKRLLVRQLLIGHFTTLFPEQLDLDTTFDALCA